MKNFTSFLLAICAVLIANASFSLTPNQFTSEKNHLMEVNKEWYNYLELTSSKSISFANDKERIRYHLLSVESILRSKATTHLSRNQKQNRLNMLDVLHQYALAMQFPINTFHAHRQPYFIDIFQTHCAVGYLVMKSGNGDISQRISETQNYAYVREIESPELIQWSDDYGFTVEELAWIQPAYMDETPYAAVGGGTNGRVRFIDRVPSDSDTYIAGDFTMLGDLPCLNVAVYDGNQLSCLGGGLDGVINGLSVQKGFNGQPVKVLVAGRFEVNGVVYPLAKFHDGAWEYISISNNNTLDQEATCISSTIFTISVGMRVENSYFISDYSMGSNTWSNYGSFNGPVYTIARENQLFAGNFTKIYDYYFYFDEEDNPVIVQDTISTKNVAILSYQYSPQVGNYINHWSGITENVPDIVYTSVEIGNNTYLGGSSNGSSQENDVILTRIYGTDAQPLIELSQIETPSYNAIYDMELNPANDQLQIGGDLTQINLLSDAMMFTGRHLFTYNLITGYLHPRGYFDEPVYAVESKTGMLMVGGDFSSSSFQYTGLNHLAKNDHILSIENMNNDDAFSVFPNPTTSEIRIAGVEGNETWVEVCDINGKIVISRQLYQESIHVEALQNGTYFATISTKDSSNAIVRFVKM